jgi:DUF4097 and DUF4098 domain-containing protein YvlB
MTTLDVPDELTLDLSLPVGRAEIVAGPAGKATIEMTADGPLGQQLIDQSRVEVVGKRLIVHAPEGNFRAFSLFRSWRSGSLHLRVTVPEGTSLDAGIASTDLDVDLALADAEVRCASGDVRLGDVTGRASVNSASGDVQIGVVGGDLHVATASGDIRVRSVDGHASMRTASGDVWVGHLGDGARLRSVSGDIDVQRLTGGDVDIASTSGDLRLRIAPGLQIHLDVASVSGDLSSDLGAGDEDSGAIDLSLRARSVSGDVTITRARASNGATVV